MGGAREDMLEPQASMAAFVNELFVPRFAVRPIFSTRCNLPGLTPRSGSLGCAMGILVAKSERCPKNSLLDVESNLSAAFNWASRIWE